MWTNSLPTGDRSIYHKAVQTFSLTDRFNRSVSPTASAITDRLRVLLTSSVKVGVNPTDVQFDIYLSKTQRKEFELPNSAVLPHIWNVRGKVFS